MRIVCLMDDLNVGGVEKGLLTLARGLPAGARLEMITLFAEGTLADAFRESGVEVWHAGLTRWNAPLCAARIVGRLRRRRPDAVMGARIAARSLAAFCGRLAGTPIRLMRWGSVPGAEGARWLFVERLATRFANRFIACAREVARQVERAYHLAPGRVKVAPSVVEFWDRAALPDRATVRRRLGVPPDAPLIGSVANLNWRKDHATLLRAFAAVRAERADALLFLVGDGPLRGALESQARDLGLGESVRFLGMRHDVPAILAALDVYALPSIREGMSVALREAMWAGAPCVASRVGGIPEVVVDGETGFLVEPQDAEGLAARLGQLIRDRDLRRRMGEAGHASVARRFAAEDLARRFLNAFEAQPR